MASKPKRPGIVTRTVEQLIPYERNPRTHSEAQISQIAASVKEFGWTSPILIDEGNGVIAGHGRLMAARKLGMVEVPCIILEGLTETQKRALVIADNRLALNAGWDEELLATELRDLAESDLDLDMLGFEDFELDRYLNSDTVAGDASSEWKGMPEFTHEDKTAWRSVYIHFKDQAALEQFAQLVGQKLTDATKYIWYPQAEIEQAADKRYGTE